MIEDISNVSLHEKIVEQIKERHEDFVLSYILPYCQENTEYHINKADLKHALWLFGMEREGKLQLQYDEHKMGKWEEKYMTEEEWIRGAPSKVCPFCQKVNRNGKTPYCPHCGEKMEVDE